MGSNKETKMSHLDCPCGKRGFTSKTTARRAHIRSGSRLRFYLCPDSWTWHATNHEKVPKGTRKQHQ